MPLLYQLFVAFREGCGAGLIYWPMSQKLKFHIGDIDLLMKLCPIGVSPLSKGYRIFESS